MEGDIDVIWVRRKQKYFCKDDWTGQITLNAQVFFVAGERRPELSEQLRNPERCIEPQFALRLRDRNGAIILGDIIDAFAVADRQQCYMRGGIDMDQWRPGACSGFTPLRIEM
jgi:hypothetical protein